MGPPLRSKAALLQVASFQKSKAWPVTATWTTELTSAETQKYVPQLFIAPAEMLYAKKGRDVGSCGISYWEDLEKYFTICLHNLSTPNKCHMTQWVWEFQQQKPSIACTRRLAQQFPTYQVSAISNIPFALPQRLGASHERSWRWNLAT